MAEFDDEFERIARENKDLQDVDWAKVTVFEFGGLSARMPYENYRGAVERLRRGMLHHRMTVAQAVGGIEKLPWSIRVHVIRTAAEEILAMNSEEMTTAEKMRQIERAKELHAYLLKVFKQRPAVNERDK